MDGLLLAFLLACFAALNVGIFYLYRWTSSNRTEGEGEIRTVSCLLCGFRNRFILSGKQRPMTCRCGQQLYVPGQRQIFNA